MNMPVINNRFEEQEQSVVIWMAEALETAMPLG
jgi:hypothetical protein